MQRLSLAAITFVLLVAPLAANSGFLDGLKPSDFSAAGLDQLSAKQRATLEALVEAYKKGAVQQDRQDAPRPAAPPVVAESTRALSSPGTPAPSAKQGFFGRLKVTLQPGTEIDYAAVTSTIRGEFSGWGAHTVFVLANGERWQVANGDTYYTPAIKDIEVEIVPAKLGGFWMKIPALHTEVRVKQVPGK
jgi:hypothetical protein